MHHVCGPRPAGAPNPVRASRPLRLGHSSKIRGRGARSTHHGGRTRTTSTAGAARLAGLAALAALGVLLGAGLTAAQTPTLVLELEAGPAWQSYNDVEIPNDGSATRFSLYDLAGGGPWPAGRVYLTWNPGERHGVRVLVAPVSITEAAVSGQEVRFAGATYAAGETLRATYTFNSYRLSYRYRWRESARTNAWVGFTAKVRDAVIALEGEGGTSSRKDDLGFVPLLHVAGTWRLAPSWQVDLDLDGLAGGPGRAVDAAIKLGYAPGGAWSVHAGYRTVEGGADVSEVYAFAWLHYGVVSVAWRW